MNNEIKVSAEKYFNVLDDIPDDESGYWEVSRCVQVTFVLVL